jgi:hypothetical protein
MFNMMVVNLKLIVQNGNKHTFIAVIMVPLCTEVIITVAYICSAVAVNCVTLPLLWVKEIMLVLGI